MKTLEQVKAETPVGTVFTFEKFCELVEGGNITAYDGFGNFHDGEKETDIDVYDNNVSLTTIANMPYVIWYNK